MKKPINFSEVVVEEFTQRGKTITIQNETTFRMPLLTTIIADLTEDDFGMRAIARKFFPKASHAELMNTFNANHRIKSITVIKQIGETYESIDDEWL